MFSQLCLFVIICCMFFKGMKLCRSLFCMIKFGVFEICRCCVSVWVVVIFLCMVLLFICVRIWVVLRLSVVVRWDKVILFVVDCMVIRVLWVVLQELLFVICFIVIVNCELCREFLFRIGNFFIIKWILLFVLISLDILLWV